MKHAERRELTACAFDHAVRDKLREASDVLDRLFADSNMIQMFGVCCMFAGIGADAVRRQYAAREVGPVDFMYLVPEPDDTKTSPTRAFARRFIVAFTNRDHDMAKALFLVAYQAAGDQFERSVAALLIEAADLHADVCKTHHR
jgi:hypothetical protein